jgi:hypothetical protein
VPASYLTLAEGTPVLASDGVRVGVVEHVLADESVDVFDGVIVDTREGPGGWRFVDAPEVAAIEEDEVRLTIDSDAVARLPEPSANAATMQAGADETVPDHLSDKLRRAWDVLSGKY